MKTLPRSFYAEHSLAFPPQEAELAKYVVHPNVVRFLEVLQTPDAISLVQEECRGGDLFECLQRVEIFPEFLVRCLFKDLLSGVQYLHGEHIAHRDLKAENCVLGLEGTLRIADFGNATRFSPGQLFSEFHSHLSVAPPEILLCTPYDAPPIDVWAMGVLLYDMVMGDLPNCQELQRGFHEDTLTVEFASLITQILHENPGKRASLSEVAASDWLSLPARLAPNLNVVLVSQKVPSPTKVPEPGNPLPTALQNRLIREFEGILSADMGF